MAQRVAAVQLAERLNHLRLSCGAETAADWQPPGAQGSGPQAAACAGGALLVHETRQVLPGPALPLTSLVVLPDSHAWHVDDWVYIDTETSGLSSGVGNLAFMVGVARYRDPSTLEIRQYQLCNFAAERDMLGQLREWVGRDATLVSYNGRCFDLPLLQTRCRLQRVDDRLSELAHLDLLYPVRRAYARHWPDCRLQTVERNALGLLRHNDLPGAMAPAAWQSWLRYADPEPMRQVLRHNLQDLVSLALLHRHLADLYSRPGSRRIDWAAVARSWQACGRLDQALAHLLAGWRRRDPAAGLQLAQMYRRRGDWQFAEAVWQELCAQGNETAALALSKYYEHQCRDYDRALRYAGHCTQHDTTARAARLRRKLRASEAPAGYPAGGQIALELPLRSHPGDLRVQGTR